MDILRLAMKHAPNETKKILKNINNYDKKISNEVSSITKLKQIINATYHQKGKNK